MTAQALPLPATAPAQRFGKGIFTKARNWLFDEKPDRLKVQDHTRLMSAVGRFVSPTLLILCSLAFTLQLAGDSMTRALAALFSGGAFVPGDFINAATTNVLVVAMDVGMILAFLRVRDDLMRGKVSQIGTVCIWFGSIVAAIEAATFFSMLVQADPITLGQWYRGVLDAARSIMAPLTAIFLVVLPARTLTADEIEHNILIKVAEILLSKLNQLAFTAEAAFGDMMQLFLHLSYRDDGETDRATVDARMAKLEELLQRISPAAMQKYFDDMRTQLESQLSDAERRGIVLLQDALLGLATVGEIPAHVVDVAPNLAGLSFANIARKPAKTVAQVKAGGADDLRAEAVEVGGIEFVVEYIEKDAADIVTKDKKGVEIKKKATKKAFGPWIKSSQIVRFARAKAVDPDEAKQIAMLCGNGAKAVGAGQAYVAPLRAVLLELAKRNKLDPRFNRFTNSGQNDGEFADESTPNDSTLIQENAEV